MQLIQMTLKGLGLDIAPVYEGNGILGLETDNIYEGIEDHMADISQSDIDAYMKNSMVENMDSDSAAEIIKMETGNTTLNAGDIDIIKKYKEKTKPTGKFRV